MSWQGGELKQGLVRSPGRCGLASCTYNEQQHFFPAKTSGAHALALGHAEAAPRCTAFEALFPT